MSTVKAKDTEVTLAGNDLSEFLNDSDYTRSPDRHDLTTYKKGSHVYDGSLGDGSTTLAGIYDTEETNGPRAVIEPIVGTVVVMTYKPEGTGTGKPLRTVDVFVGEYKETHPVADHVMWTLQLQHSDDPVVTIQA